MSESIKENFREIRLGMQTVIEKAVNALRKLLILLLNKYFDSLDLILIKIENLQ